jgi:hypothetical protein
VDNAADVFVVSSKKLLQQLSQDPYAGDDSLAFALTIDAAFKQEALKARNLAQDLEYSQFESEVFDQVLQERISLDALKKWSAQLTTIKTELSRAPHLSTVRGDLVRNSLKWLKKGELNENGLTEIYSALNNSMQPFEESTKLLVKDLEQSLGAQKEALDFARTLSAEYKQLALQIRNNAVASNYEGWGKSFFNSILQSRPPIETIRGLNALWTAAFDFTKREKERSANEFGSQAESNRKTIIDRAIKESWSPREFTALETIAPLAKFKSFCTRHKAISSLAECATMNLFSKEAGKFFDPAFDNRYASLANTFISHMKQMSDSQWVTMQWNLLDKFFGTWTPIWSKCDNSLFSQKASTLDSQLTALRKQTDQFKKWELERQIKSTLEDCQ